MHWVQSSERAVVVVRALVCVLVFAFDLAFSVNLSLHERKDGPDGGWPVFAPTIRAI